MEPIISIENGTAERIQPLTVAALVRRLEAQFYPNAVLGNFKFEIVDMGNGPTR